MPRKEDDGEPAVAAASEGGGTSAPTTGERIDAGATSGSSSADASAGDAASCAKACVDLGLPCCWMGDCAVDPSCKAQLCD